MKKLDKVPFETLKVGARCISAIGTHGRIVKVWHDNRYVPNDEDGDMIEIYWDSGNYSYDQHYNFNKVTYVGEDALPERDITKTSKQQGMFKKFHVTRVDGRYPEREYFVLDIHHDQFAKAAMEAYANTCEDEYPLLAADIRKKWLES